MLLQWLRCTGIGLAIDSFSGSGFPLGIGDLCGLCDLLSMGCIGGITACDTCGNFAAF